MAHDPTAQRHERAYQCMGEILTRTIDSPTEAAQRQALHTLLDVLSPWVSPRDLPTLVRQPFLLCNACHFAPHREGDDATVWIGLFPAGAALFRAWLSSRGVDPCWWSACRRQGATGAETDVTLCRNQGVGFEETRGGRGDLRGRSL